jgi:hypothetical protein
MVLTGQMKEIESAAAIIVAEAQSESWIARSWRPLLMLLFASSSPQLPGRAPLSAPRPRHPPYMWSC